MKIPVQQRQCVCGYEEKRNFLLFRGQILKNNVKGFKINQNDFIIGNSASDKLVQQAEIRDHSIPTRTKPPILICTQPLINILEENEIITIEAMLTNLVNRNLGWYFIIKIHPRENIEKYKKLFVSQLFDSPISRFPVKTEQKLIDIAIYEI